MGFRKITNIKMKPDIIDRIEIIDILNLDLELGIWILEFGFWVLAFRFRVMGPFWDESLVTSPN